MTTKNVPVRGDEEVWELTVPGRVHVPFTNHLGRPADASARGKGSRIRLSTLDRELAEEAIRDIEHNPFRNGMLVQVVGTNNGDGSNSLTDAEMLELFNLKFDDFETVLKDLSELNVRRLRAMSEPADASSSQIRSIEELIATRWPIGNSTPTYDEMMA